MSLDFAPPMRRARGESIVPMINVVFLLLVFFLMTSRLASPEPFEVAPPVAEDSGKGETAPALFLSAEGEIGFRDLRGEAAVAAFAALAQDGMTPRLRADAGVEATAVARLMRELSAAGLKDVALVVSGQ